MTDRRDEAQRRARSTRFWDEARETMPRHERDQLILDRIQHQLHYVYEKLPFYRRHYDDHGFKPSDVKSLADFTAKVPVITKKMLVENQQQHPPFGDYLGVPRNQLARIHGSSGTMGKPTMYGVSRRDWDRAREASAMALWSAGVRPDDIVQITFPFALFFGGWGILQATEQIGATTFPTGSVVPTDKQIELMHTLDCDVVVGTPSYLVHLAQRSRELGLDVRDSKVSLLVAGGEPGASIASVRELLMQLWANPLIVDASAGSTSEMYPFLSNIGCTESDGGVHLFQDENYTEIVDRNDPNILVPAGTSGATVATHLWRESQPMIRFWMGDEGVIDDTPCPCGRTYPRLPRGVFGRVDDMLIIRGANVYPSAIEAAVRGVDGAGAEFRIFVERENALDELRVEVEHEPDMDTKGLEQLRQSLEAAIKLSIQIRVPVSVVAPGTHEQQTFKSRRVVDNRPKA
ncbi:phenylacetate--CoA ligase family protein [Nocardia sp. NPDC051990]|uniref:phenylacetate--CoA ligase family protein n=1 Tax=Nocardia sp. NPDC051990 TaxID=3155285 RepID=UPI0034395764